VQWLLRAILKPGSVTDRWLTTIQPHQIEITIRHCLACGIASRDEHRQRIRLKGTHTLDDGVEEVLREVDERCGFTVKS
jgi:hypothetical protein